MDEKTEVITLEPAPDEVEPLPPAAERYVDELIEDVEIDELSIDGMCGVY